MKIKPIKATVLLCLSVLVAGPVATRLVASEINTSSAANKSTPALQPARIVIVDKPAKTLTVALNGKLYLLKTGSQLKLTANGKAISLDDLAPGQEVKVATRATAAGGSEIVALNLEPKIEHSEAAAAKKRQRRNGPRPPQIPGHGEWGGIVSPNR